MLDLRASRQSDQLPNILNQTIVYIFHSGVGHIIAMSGLDLFSKRDKKVDFTLVPACHYLKSYKITFMIRIYQSGELDV